MFYIAISLLEFFSIEYYRRLNYPPAFVGFLPRCRFGKVQRCSRSSCQAAYSSKTGTAQEVHAAKAIHISRFKDSTYAVASDRDAKSNQLHHRRV